MQSLQQANITFLLLVLRFLITHGLLFSGLNDTKGIISTIFVSLICCVYCVNWPLFQNAAERFSFLRKCELHTCVEKTQNRHSLNCMLGVLCD